MIITINFNDFCDYFKKQGRESTFTYEAKKALFDYLEELDPDYELDPVELCGEWGEYTSEELIESYSYLMKDTGKDNLFETIQEHTEIIELDNRNYLLKDF